MSGFAEREPMVPAWFAADSAYVQPPGSQPSARSTPESRLDTLSGRIARVIY